MKSTLVLGVDVSKGYGDFVLVFVSKTSKIFPAPRVRDVKGPKGSDPPDGGEGRSKANPGAARPRGILSAAEGCLGDTP